MKRADIPNLDDLRAFEATARNGSVRAAADEVALTHAAISRRNNRLARYAGARLFERVGRGLRLTLAGQQLQDACRRSFDDLSRTIAGIREAEATPSGVILLSCERSVAMRWLIPRLSQFQDANPSIAVHLSVGGGTLERTGDTDTLALRRLDFVLTGEWSSKTLWRETVGPVMTPALHARFAEGDYIALGTRTRPEAWASWLAHNPQAPRPSETRMLDHHFLMVEAACGGLGVGLAPRVVAIDDLERERLIAPYGFSPDGSCYGVLYRSDTSLGENTVRLVDWLTNLSADL